MKYYLIAGERSGDLHASNLIKAIKRKDPDAVFRGVGGDFMSDAGMNVFIHYNKMAVMGFLEVLMNVFKFRKFMKDCQNDIQNFSPDAVIFVDYAGFNLRMAARMHKTSSHKFYYIVPKIWAWNQKRALKIRKYIDDAFVILPFEENFYAKYSINAKYIGNPVLDAIGEFDPEAKFEMKHQVVGTSGIIALLPGSRKQEIQNVIPCFAELARSFPGKTFGLSIVSNLPEELYKEVLDESNVVPVIENNYNLLLNAEAAVVTSGTATLETALFEVPQVVVYKASNISYQIAKRLIQIKYISLVNLIVDEPLVKELIQHDLIAENLVEEMTNILENQAHKKRILAGYKRILSILGENNASQNAAKEIVEILNSKTSEFA